jgi:hypothetical protein
VVLTDLAGNDKEGLPSSGQLTVDTGIPVDFTVGEVVVSEGVVESGYWNGSNSSLTVSVPIADDVSLVDGTVQVQGRVDTGSYAALGSAVSLSSGDLGTNKVISIIDLDLSGHADYDQGQVFSFGAVLTDVAGNKKEGSPSSDTLQVDTVVPRGGLSYTVGGVAVSRVKQDVDVLVTATMSEAIANAPVLQLSASGSNTISAVGMTRDSTTSYSYLWRVGAGDGTTSFVLSLGRDLAGNVVAATPTTGVGIVVDNTVPSDFTLGVVTAAGF